MEEHQLVRLVEGAVVTEAGWQRLWAVLEPTLWQLVGRPRFASHLAHTEQTRQRIVSAIRDHLAADRCAHLQRFLGTRRLKPRLSFAWWLRTVAKRIAMRYARSEAPVAEVCRPCAHRTV